MRRGRPPYPDILTPREWEVLELLRQGLTNEQIAERLGISRDGAKYHVAEILSKLGVSSREAAAAWRPVPKPWWAGALVFLGWPRKGLPTATVAKIAVGTLVVGGMGLGLVALIAALGGVFSTQKQAGELVATSATPTAGQQAVSQGGANLIAASLDDPAEAPLAGVYIHRNYAFVGGMSTGYTTNANVGVRIVDLSDPSNPVLVGRIPLRSRGYLSDHTHGDAVATSIDTTAFRGDIAIVLNGVPDEFAPESYPQPYGIWDVTDPSSPKFLNVLNFGLRTGGNEQGDLGDKPNDARAVAAHHFYALYGETTSPRNVHLAVVDLSDPHNPVVVGDWQGSAEVIPLGLSVNKTGTQAYIVGVTPPPYGRSTQQIVLNILDVRNPTRPVEVGRYIHRSAGLHTPYAVANDDDSLVIMADGRWGSLREGCALPHGRLHILDISNLGSIRELSTFAIPETESLCDGLYQATDVAVRGNLIYSTWLKGGLRVVDISDPARPVQVGEFHGPQACSYNRRANEVCYLSDVALYQDAALATTVWWSGLFVLR